VQLGQFRVVLPTIRLEFGELAYQEAVVFQKELWIAGSVTSRLHLVIAHDKSPTTGVNGLLRRSD